jgi:hypothetical protein
VYPIFGAGTAIHAVPQDWMHGVDIPPELAAAIREARAIKCFILFLL